MADLMPIVQVDTREQEPLHVQKYEIERVALPVGDYGVKGFSDWSNPAFIAERKSVDDLVGSLIQGRDRFMREIEKMRQFRFACLLIESERIDIISHAYKSKANPVSILATLDAISVRTNIHVFWCGSADGAARQLESLVRQFSRGIVKDFRRLEKAKVV